VTSAERDGLARIIRYQAIARPNGARAHTYPRNELIATTLVRDAPFGIRWDGTRAAWLSVRSPSHGEYA